MHEMSMAQGVLDIVLDYAAKNEAKRVKEISLLIGEMTGVVFESLEFCFTSLAKGTIASEAKLKLNLVPLVGQCPDCNWQGHIERYNFLCPQCGSAALKVISGRELRVEYLDIE